MKYLEKIIISIISCVVFNVGITQPAQTDSVLLQLKNAKHDTVKIELLNKLSQQSYVEGNYQQGLQYAENAITLSESAGFKSGLALAWHNMGNSYYSKSEYEKSLEAYSQSIQIKQTIGDKHGIAASTNNIGNIYLMKGQYDKATEYFLKALAVREQVGDKKGVADSYLTIGVVYSEQNLLKQSVEFYTKAIKLYEELGDKKRMAVVYNNIGNAEADLFNYDKALEYHFKALQIREEEKDKRGTASSYSNIGNVLSSKIEQISAKNGEKANYKQVLKFYNDALNILNELGDKQAISFTRNIIGIAYLKQGLIDKARTELLNSLKLAEELNIKPIIQTAYLYLSLCDSAQSNFFSAYNYHKLYAFTKDSMFNEHTTEQIAEMQTKYETEKKEKEIEVQNLQITAQNAELNKKQITIYAAASGIFLLLLLSVFIYWGYRQKQKSNLLLEEKNILIEAQKKLVEERNQDITDSITYAKHIQDAMLPEKEKIKEALPESFILYLPKDIVSGDFYWMYVVAHPQPLPLGGEDCYLQILFLPIGRK